ncbi:hypothetical protein cypCar_00041217 [Cyprinus carpio]|nr:hypothetical protein cypCar_00041217 [Cyprinus carpio]
MCCEMLSRWRFTFYLYIFTYGVRFLKKSPWLWNTRECWYNYPYQPLTVDLHYYYILELSFYLSLLFSQFTDIRRKFFRARIEDVLCPITASPVYTLLFVCHASTLFFTLLHVFLIFIIIINLLAESDFLLMFLHHVATISLITFSYVNNMARVGTLVMCLHDAADILLEAAKMANYGKCQRLCNVLFVMFALVFISSRLGVYPVWILNTTVFESWEIVGPYPSWWVFNVLLVLLQALHTFWSYLIVRIACRAISRGKVSKDDRSDIESSSDEDEVLPPSQKHHTNGTNGAHGTNGYLSSSPCPDEH